MANTTTKTVRVTKVQKFEAIKNFMEQTGDTLACIAYPGTDDKEGVTIDAQYIIDFCNSEIALLQRKKTGTSPKEAKKKEQDEHLKGLIYDFLSGQLEGRTCTEIRKGDAELYDLNGQKIATLVNQMAAEGKLVREVSGGAPRFRIA